MSKFSAFLKELLSQRGEPIARIAKNTGLERTSIHKALKDERLLSYTAVRRLCDYLQLTLPQVRELNMYYQMLLQGEESYRTQETICELLGELSQLHFSCAESLSKEREAPPRPGFLLFCMAILRSNPLFYPFLNGKLTPETRSFLSICLRNFLLWPPVCSSSGQKEAPAQSGSLWRFFQNVPGRITGGKIFIF